MDGVWEEAKELRWSLGGITMLRGMDLPWQAMWCQGYDQI